MNKLQKENSPLISVVMATYNGEKYLQEQLDSILNQTYKNIEIIICDDCSTDKTPEILNKYAEKYENIHVYYNTENIGLNKNFAKAIELCNGEYVAISDQDDIWYENKLNLLLSNIDNNDVICARKIDIDDNHNILPDIHYKCFNFAKIFQYNETDFLRMFFVDILWGCTSLIKKTFLMNCLPFPEKNMYYDHWICLAAYVFKTLKYVDTIVIEHRIHSNNCTRRTGMENPYLRWFKSLSKENVAKYYITEIEKMDLIISRLDLPEDYERKLLELKKVYTSILNFRFSKEDIKCLFKELTLYKQTKRRYIFFIKSLFERLYLLVFNNR